MEWVSHTESDCETGSIRDSSSATATAAQGQAASGVKKEIEDREGSPKLDKKLHLPLHPAVHVSEHVPVPPAAVAAASDRDRAVIAKAHAVAHAISGHGTGQSE